MRRFLNRLEANARADHTAQPGAAANREAIVAMQHYCEGDASAFPVLYAIAAPRLFTFMRYLVCDHALAEELLQQTFLKLHQARPSGRSSRCSSSTACRWQRSRRGRA